MKFNEVFFYQGNHFAGCYFLYDAINEELSIVKNYDINFDNDEEGLSLKQLSDPKKIMTIKVCFSEALDNPNKYLDSLLDKYQEYVDNYFTKLSTF